MFDRERFVADCRAALKERSAQGAVREVVARAVADPAAVARELGAPRRSGITTLYRGADLTVLNLVWGPLMSFPPHNHNMWAVIGIYDGREDNLFWRRVEDGPAGLIEAAGAKALKTRDAVPLGPDVIHSVLNPIARNTAAIHVYGGDFFAMKRSEWDSESLLEHPYDAAETVRRFERANARG